MRLRSEVRQKPLETYGKFFDKIKTIFLKEIPQNGD